MLNVHNRLQHLVRSEDVNAAIKESGAAITSLFQFVLSRERLSAIRDDFFELVASSILSFAPRDASPTSKSFNSDLIVELAASKPKYSEAIASAIRSKSMGENVRPGNDGSGVSGNTLDALVTALQTKANMSS
jgi:hypothetical protein